MRDAAGEGATRPRPAAPGRRGSCQAFGITGAHDGIDLARARSASSTTASPPPPRPASSTRIGLAPGRGDDLPWRFFVPGDPQHQPMAHASLPGSVPGPMAVASTSRSASSAPARSTSSPRPTSAASSRTGRPLRVKLGHRPHRVRHPSRVRGRAAQAAPVPGARAHRGADHRRLHRAGRRPVGQVGHPAAPHEGGGRRSRRRPTSSRSAHPRSPTSRSRSAATPSGSARWASRTCCASRPHHRRPHARARRLLPALPRRRRRSR